MFPILTFNLPVPKVLSVKAFSRWNCAYKASSFPGTSRKGRNTIIFSFLKSLKPVSCARFPPFPRETPVNKSIEIFVAFSAVKT